ncbi:MAG: serine--tRNA ligase [Bacteroidetes bacterium CG18_big_fil_WC_8_21_14_2_50_41_14]|nr:MAG: serine--tRNA ligase [Bacteroidetes bacterium CG18_big_fil_WC_8_21_14_2_50_41_14]PJB58164.1 MAG: serine--tRNA ligase [Bacteroidetes bacterium CG_4_9_14_3_um_filter_41_19]
MLQLQKIRENRDQIIERLAVKNFKATALVDEIIELDNTRRNSQKELDDILALSNQLAKEIGNHYAKGEQGKAELAKQESLKLKAAAKAIEPLLMETVELLNAKLIELPNLPHTSVPNGKTPEDNEIIYEEGVMPRLPENAVPHWDLASTYKIVDFELGNKVTGAGFPFYRGKGARLQRALINFFLDEAIEAGYTEYQPPLLVNAASGYGTGQLPDKEGQMYFAPEDNLYLIPTAEVPLTNIYRDVIVKENDFPIKNVAYSNCFRREAGSYGKDVRGLNRLHQFDKVEIVQIQHPDKSYQTLEEMKEHVAGLLRKLELPFRILRLCGGDMSFTSALTYDFEVFSAAQNRWLEVSSVSNFEDFQANRMKLRFKDKEGKTRLAHTLNGSALALPRVVAALLENNQSAEGIKIPDALTNYTGFKFID